MIDTKALRKKILDLAISGKLTEQLPEDGNAEDLYAQIQEEKAKLISEGKIKKEKSTSKILESEKYATIPNNWKWAKLGELALPLSDGVHFAPKYQKAGIPCFSAKDIYNNSINDDECTYISEDDYILMKEKINVKKDSVLITKSGSIGRSAVVKKYFEFGLVESIGVVNVIHTVPEYLKIIFDLGFVYSMLFSTNYTRGVGLRHLTLTLLSNIPIPLPPLAEQKRIVSAVEDAFAVIDRIEKAQESYYADQEVLKNKIIDAGIRGKLTEQLPEDGNAEDLLNIYAAKKAEIESSGVLKGRKKKKVMALEGIEYPFRIPSTWRWTRLDSVAEIFGRIGFRGYTKDDIVGEGKGAISLSPSNITKDGTVVFDKCTYITWEKYYESPEIMVYEDDIIIVKTGSSYGKCTIAQNMPEKATINPQLAVLKYILCDRQYLHIVLNSSMAHKQYNDFVVGAATPTFSQEDLANFLLPLPPIAEQKRIVEIINHIKNNYLN